MHYKMYDQPMLCPLNPGSICPLTLDHSRFVREDSISKESLSDGSVHMNQMPENINRMMRTIDKDLTGYYTQLQGYGIQRSIAQWLFISVITYVLRNAGNYSGTNEQKSAKMLADLKKDNMMIFNMMKGYGIPQNVIDNALLAIIILVLNSLNIPGPGPGPGPRPGKPY
ncbi:MAG: hypothetical protein K0R19_3382 [Bacillota bacterium]|nr:hypothetical protein [Bacillota bacterium]